jgi:hypothetical protein
MPKRKTLVELERTIVKRDFGTDKEFLELADILLTDHLAFDLTESYWNLNFLAKGKGTSVKAHTFEELHITMDMLLMQVINRKMAPPTDISFIKRYNLGIDEVLISLYYASPLEMDLGKPRAATISSTTNFDLPKEIIPADEINQKYEELSKKTSKDVLALAFEDNKIPYRPPSVFKDNQPRYNLNLAYLLEAAKIVKEVIAAKTLK